MAPTSPPPDPRSLYIHAPPLGWHRACCLRRTVTACPHQGSCPGCDPWIDTCAHAISHGGPNRKPNSHMGRQPPPPPLRHPTVPAAPPPHGQHPHLCSGKLCDAADGRLRASKSQAVGYRLPSARASPKPAPPPLPTGCRPAKHLAGAAANSPGGGKRDEGCPFQRSWEG